MAHAIDLAVLGGSGFYEMPGLDLIDEVFIDTPFGPPSDAIRIGMLGGVRVAFMARHGRGHSYLPSELPQRANFWALKRLGVERVLAVSAVGSLREDYRPGDLVIPDQLIDRTSGAAAADVFRGWGGRARGHGAAILYVDAGCVRPPRPKRRGRNRAAAGPTL